MFRRPADDVVHLPEDRVVLAPALLEDALDEPRQVLALADRDDLVVGALAASRGANVFSRSTAPPADVEQRTAGWSRTPSGRPASATRTVWPGCRPARARAAAFCAGEFAFRRRLDLLLERAPRLHEPAASSAASSPATRVGSAARGGRPGRRRGRPSAAGSRSICGEPSRRRRPARGVGRAGARLGLRAPADVEPVLLDHLAEAPVVR